MVKTPRLSCDELEKEFEIGPEREGLHSEAAVKEYLVSSVEDALESDVVYVELCLGRFGADEAPQDSLVLGEPAPATSIRQVQFDPLSCFVVVVVF